MTRDLSWTAPFVGEPNVADAPCTVTARGNDIDDDRRGRCGRPMLRRLRSSSCAAATSAPDNRAGSPRHVHRSPSLPARAARPATSLDRAPGVHDVATRRPGASTSNLTYTAPQVSKRGQYFPTKRPADGHPPRGSASARARSPLGQTVSLPVAGHNGVPATGVSAAVFNVTVTGATSSSFATVYPGGTARPATSNLNFPKGFTGANLVTVPLGSNGAVRLLQQRRARRSSSPTSSATTPPRRRSPSPVATTSTPPSPNACSTPAPTGASSWTPRSTSPCRSTSGPP